MGIKLDVREVIQKPIISEAAGDGIPRKVYTFKVAKSATKPMIKDAVEEIFGVTVKSVNTSIVKRKPKTQGIHRGYKDSWKKAVVALTEESKSIAFFEGLN